MMASSNIKVKLMPDPSRNDTRGIMAFRQTYPKLKMAPGLVIAPMDKFQKISEYDYTIPWDAGY